MAKSKKYNNQNRAHFPADMMFQNVYLVDDALSLIDIEAIKALEDRLGIPFPDGYRQFLTTLGEGTYCDQLYLLLPGAIERETTCLRKLVSEHFFWERGKAVLTMAEIAVSFNIGRSIDGDEIIYNPNTAHRIYVLPRHDDTIY